MERNCKWAEPNEIRVSVGTTDITFVNFEHEDLAIHPEIRRRLQDPDTRVIVPEYFYPEIEYNTPVFLKERLKNERMKDPTSQYTDRLWYAYELAQYLKKLKKPVAVCDVANTPQYLLAETMIRRTPTIAAAAALLVTGPSYGLIAGPLIDTFWAFQRRDWSLANEGIYDHEYRHIYESYILELNDARHMVITQGLVKLAHQYPDSQIVTLYPEANGLRIAHYIHNPPEIKRNIYTPFLKAWHLETALRQWEWKDNTVGHWNCFSIEPL